MSGDGSSSPLTGFVRAHLGVALAVTCVTAWFSYGCFHNDEYFQVIEFTRWKLGEVDLMPWEHQQQMRPWLQPFIYWLVARPLVAAGVRDIFILAFVFRLLTGLANAGALALFVRATLPAIPTLDEKRLHVRVACATGFLPYLFVRTSSESGSMAALTAAVALLVAGAVASGDGRAWSVPVLARPVQLVLAGVLFGLAFEMRFQTAFVAVGVLGWLRFIARARLASFGWLGVGGVLVLAGSALVDRWGYGVWTFPPWTYFRKNLLEGAAASFGSDPPFAYFWISPANVFFPLVLTLLVLAVLAWGRCPRHPITWATLPFFLVHNLIAHKEERFLFPIAVLATAFVTMAIGPSFGARRSNAGVATRVAAWGWSRRARWPGKVLVLWSTAGLALLMFVPLGWHLNVRFTRFIHENIGEELHATALPEVDLHFPAFHPRVYDVDTAEPEEIVRRIDAGTARPWLIADRPILRTETSLDDRATVVFSELPVFRDRVLTERVLRLVDAYNASAPHFLRRLRYRTLYRVGP
jgi:phosphatidylinositol glycan class B